MISLKRFILYFTNIFSVGEAPAAEETPAQAKARAHASLKLQMERFSRIWTWLTEVTGYNR